MNDKEKIRLLRLDIEEFNREKIRDLKGDIVDFSSIILDQEKTLKELNVKLLKISKELKKEKHNHILSRRLLGKKHLFYKKRAEAYIIKLEKRDK